MYYLSLAIYITDV